MSHLELFNDINNIMNERKHPRMTKIYFKPCNDTCPKSGELQKIEIFKRHSRLRYHAVKHLISDSGRSRISQADISIELIERCRKQLTDIGCPYYLYDFDECLCGNHIKYCSYNECLKIKDVNIVEEKYLKLITEELKNCGTKPRYACYYSKEKKNLILGALSESKIMIYSEWMQDSDAYNVTTCRMAKYGRKMVEVADKESSKIDGEAKKGSISWCSEKEWFKSEPLAAMELAFKKAGMAIDQYKKQKKKIG